MKKSLNPLTGDQLFSQEKGDKTGGKKIFSVLRLGAKILRQRRRTGGDRISGILSAGTEIDIKQLLFCRSNLCKGHPGGRNINQVAAIQDP